MAAQPYGGRTARGVLFGGGRGKSANDRMTGTLGVGGRTGAGAGGARGRYQQLIDLRQQAQAMLEEREQYAHELEAAAAVRRQHLDHFAKLNGYLTNLTPLAEAREAAKKAKHEGNESAFLDDADGFMRLAPASEQLREFHTKANARTLAAMKDNAHWYSAALPENLGGPKKDIRSISTPEFVAHPFQEWKQHRRQRQRKGESPAEAAAAAAAAQGAAEAGAEGEGEGEAKVESATPHEEKVAEGGDGRKGFVKGQQVQYQSEAKQWLDATVLGVHRDDAQVPYYTIAYGPDHDRREKQVNGSDRLRATPDVESELSVARERVDPTEASVWWYAWGRKVTTIDQEGKRRVTFLDVHGNATTDPSYGARRHALGAEGAEAQGEGEGEGEGEERPFGPPKGDGTGATDQAEPNAQASQADVLSRWHELGPAGRRHEAETQQTRLEERSRKWASQIIQEVERQRRVAAGPRELEALRRQRMRHEKYAVVVIQKAWRHALNTWAQRRAAAEARVNTALYTLMTELRRPELEDPAWRSNTNATAGAGGGAGHAGGYGPTRAAGSGAAGVDALRHLFAGLADPNGGAAPPLPPPSAGRPSTSKSPAAANRHNQLPPPVSHARTVRDVSPVVTRLGGAADAASSAAGAGRVGGGTPKAATPYDPLSRAMGVPMPMTVAGTALHGAGYPGRPGSAAGAGANPRAQAQAGMPRTAPARSKAASPGLNVQLPAAPRKYMEGAAVEVLTPRGTGWKTAQVVAVRPNPRFAGADPSSVGESETLMYDLKPLEVSPKLTRGGEVPRSPPREPGMYQAVPPHRLRTPAGTSATPMNIAGRSGRVLHSSTLERPRSVGAEGAPAPASDLRPAPLSAMQGNVDDNSTVRSMNLSTKFEGVAAEQAMTYSASPSLESQPGSSGLGRSFARG